jgi:hypothetical protein
LWSFAWKAQPPQETITPKETLPPNQTPTSDTMLLTVSVQALKPRQKIYGPDDVAYVDFVINNTLKVPYNITVDWLFNNTRYHGWSTMSTSNYSVNQEVNNWWSNYPGKKAVGLWEVHLQIVYQINNQTFTKDETTQFRVI